MNWSETRKKLLHLASGRSERSVGSGAVLSPFGEPCAGALDLGPPPEASSGVPFETNGARRADRPAEAAPPREASSLCIASGKGGTGKSVVSASLAALFSSRGRTLVVDADLGVGNAHILQDVSPQKSFVDVVQGRLSVREVLVRCSEEIDLLAAGSGVPRMADLSGYELHLIANGLRELESEYRFLIVDSAAGVSRQTMSFAEACDLTLVVTTPDITAMTDAYAFLKVLLARRPEPRPYLLVNRASSDDEAREVVARIGRVCHRFIGIRPRSLGWLPDDHAVVESVNRRGAVVRLEPNAPSSYALRRAAVVLAEELGHGTPGGMGRRLLDSVGFPRRLT